MVGTATWTGSGSMRSMVPHYRPWPQAWARAATGPGGFWRTETPQQHFRTASSASDLLAEAVLGLLHDHPSVRSVVELGAGAGWLLADLSRRRGDLELAGVDLRPRPPGLPEAVTWGRDLYDVATGGWTTGAAPRLLSDAPAPALVVCVEWLDDLPCPVARWDDGRLRGLDVAPDGRERPGGPVDADFRAWAERWWPEGDRVEVGLTRDRAWAAVLAGLGDRGGLALAVDYGHLRDRRPPAGTLAGYRHGRRYAPRPASGLNLTAAVAVDSLADAGVRAGARTLLRARQHEVLAALPPQPPAASAAVDPLADLVRRSEHAALTSPAVWGDQFWLLQELSGS